MSAPPSQNTPFRRAVMDRAGFDSDLRIETTDNAPTPRANEVLVAIEASGVCHRDLIDRAGRFPFLRTPITPGHEAVGRVIAAGERVTEWQIGDRVATMHRDFCGSCPDCEAGQVSLCQRAAHVLGLLADGGYASHIAAPEHTFYAMDDAVPAARAAVLHCTFGTAWRGLHAPGPVTDGMPILITGANGGVGLAAVELATRLGAQVTAVVRDGRHEALLLERGAKQVIVSTDGRFHKQIGPTQARALDCVGQPMFNAALRTLRVGGALMAIGNVVPERVTLNVGYIITRGLRIIGSSGANRIDMAGVLAEWKKQPFAEDGVEAVDLAEADTAQRRVLAGGLQGRIVLVP